MVLLQVRKEQESGLEQGNSKWKWDSLQHRFKAITFKSSWRIAEASEGCQRQFKGLQLEKWGKWQSQDYRSAQLSTRMKIHVIRKHLENSKERSHSQYIMTNPSNFLLQKKFGPYR